MPIRTSHADWRASLREDQRLLRKRRRQIRILRRGGRLPDDPYLTLAGAKSSERLLVQAIANKKRLLTSTERGRSTERGARNVRWYETRQERAVDVAERMGRRALHMQQRAYELDAEAARIKKRAPKKSAALSERAFRLHQRALRLAEAAGKRRASSARYGRAKREIGTYDPAYGWSDRDRRARDSVRPLSTREYDRLYRRYEDAQREYGRLSHVPYGSPRWGERQRAERKMLKLEGRVRAAARRRRVHERRS